MVGVQEPRTKTSAMVVTQDFARLCPGPATGGVELWLSLKANWAAATSSIGSESTDTISGPNLVMRTEYLFLLEHSVR